MGKEAPRWELVDPVGEALHALRMTGTFYCRSELTAPWGLTMPAIPGCIWFHAVTAGHCSLVTEGSPELELAAGDFVLIPHGHGHQLRTDASAATPVVLDLPHVLADDRYALLRHGGGGAETTLVCGIVRLEHHAAHDLLNMLPAVIHLDAFSTPHTEWMQSTLKLMAEEARQLLPGGDTLITRLADILVIQAIRSWLRSDPVARTGWLGALRDNQIGRAIALIHREPARDWSVASLATAVAMSRSAFAARFSSLVGEAPMRYLTRVRMRIASTALASEDGTTVSELSAKLGYQSEAAFSRAYKRLAGVAPGSARRGARPDR